MIQNDLQITAIYEENAKYPKGYALFNCSNCNNPLDDNAYTSLSAHIAEIAAQHKAYVSWYLASRHAGNPKYELILFSFKCQKCQKEYNALFYKRFTEQYFPEDIREFFLADVPNASLTHIDGIFERNDCQTIIQKIFIRWAIMSKVTFIATPFIGNTYQDANTRLELLNDFLYALDVERTLWVTRYETIRQIKEDFDTKYNNGAYDALEKAGKINSIITGAFKKDEFHAKFYAGFMKNGFEVVAGSHNWHGGSYVENLMFKNYSTENFIERYVMPFNVAPLGNFDTEYTGAVYYIKENKWAGRLMKFDRCPETMELISNAQRD